MIFCTSEIGRVASNRSGMTEITTSVISETIKAMYQNGSWLVQVLGGVYFQNF
jgi:hypothetical protein